TEPSSGLRLRRQGRSKRANAAGGGEVADRSSVCVQRENSRSGRQRQEVLVTIVARRRRRAKLSQRGQRRFVQGHQRLCLIAVSRFRGRARQVTASVCKVITPGFVRGGHG